MRELISDYQYIKSEIAKLNDRIETIYAAASSPKNKIITDMPLAPGFSGGGLDRVFIQIEELEERRRAYESELAEVRVAIDLKLAEVGIIGISRDVFWYREIDKKNWREVSRLTGYSRSQLSRIFKKTIYTIQLL